MSASARAQPLTRSAGAHLALSAWAVPALLFGAALVVRLCATLLVRFPITEGSVYYVDVARNLATGRGLVVDTIWSYATPPLTLPRPAFELWQPLASVIAALPMTLLGPTYGSAQIGFALLGAALSPMAWFVARDMARRMGLEARRSTWIAVGAGALAAVSGPFVFSAAVPDSTLPFTVTAAAACALMPAALSRNRRAVVALGALCGLAYLARMEAVYLGVAFTVVGWSARLAWRSVFVRGAAVAAIAAVVAAPWWLRNISTFGRPLPGQLADNAFLTRNAQIFGWSDRPSLEGFLDQGAGTLIGNVVEAFRHDIVDVLFIPAAVVAFTGVATLLCGGRLRAAMPGSPLLSLLTTGLAALVVTSAVFPVATLWGTFEHAAGPLILALVVLAALGGDAFVARVREWRRWPRSNAFLAPAALVALTIPLTLVQVFGASGQSRAEQVRYESLAATLPAALTAAGVRSDAPVITDRPLWLSDALGAQTLALPDEPVAAVLDLAHAFGARALVVVEERGPYPSALDTHPCFSEVDGITTARTYVITEACR